MAQDRNVALGVTSTANDNLPDDVQPISSDNDDLETLPRKRRPRYQRLLIKLVRLYVVVVILFFLFQRYVIFPRHMTSQYVAMRDFVPGLIELSLERPGGKTEAWYIPGNGCTAEHPGPAVIFAHGNAELIDDWPLLLKPYRERGISVLVCEYRGYGRSAGSPSQAAIGQDMLEFYDRLVARPEVLGDKIIFHGRSIGGGVMCDLATKRKPAAMVLQSTFTSIRDMAARFGMPGFLVSDPFENLEVVKTARFPIILFHGRFDNIIPYAHAERLHAAAPGSELVSYDCDHNDCPPNFDEFMGRVLEFLEQHGVLSGSNGVRSGRSANE